MTDAAWPYPTKYTTPFLLYPPSLWLNTIGSSFAQRYLGLNEPGDDYVLYLSIPFCRVRCHSCPYFVELLSVHDTQGKEQRYVDALVADLERWASYRRWRTGRLRAVYMGGGTGSILSTANLKRIVETIRQHFPLAPDCSWTLEGNARDYTPDKLDYVAASPITRVSLGVQSFNQDMLKVIGSPHAAEQSTHTINELNKRNFTNIQMDMMYNLPGHSREIWCDDLHRLNDLGIKHFTIYLYRIHDDTPQATFIKSGKVPMPVDKESTYVKNMYLDAIRTAEDMGFKMYMFDHFAVPGHENIYNEWTFKRNNTEILGVGPGAYGFINNYRVGSKKDVQGYIDAVNRGEHLINAVSDQLTPQIRKERYVMNVLQYFAVDLAEYELQFGGSFLDDFAPVVERLLRRGVCTLHRDRLEMTDLGKEWRMNVMLEFANDLFWEDARGREHPHWAMNTPMVDLFAGNRETWLGRRDDLAA
jgi:oxygen-independent coproporphyrinogen III oxidase